MFVSGVICRDTTSVPFVATRNTLKVRTPRRSFMKRPCLFAAASRDERRDENIPGDFFVTRGCIDCDVCRWMAPSVFQRVAEQSAVVHQPETEAERLRALQAAAACPVGTIRTEQPPPAALSKRARDSFPELIATSGDERSGTRVYHMGFHSAQSFGATSYLVLPAGETWRHAAFITDSPRYFRPLADRMEQLLAQEGRTLRYLFLTHIDDVADHEKWAERFHVRRVIHADDIKNAGRGPSLAQIEFQLTGSGPWLMTPDSVIECSAVSKPSAATRNAVKIIHVPGHTPGCITAIVDHFAAFTGDHIAYSATRNAVSGFPGVCWHDWNQVIESTRKLAEEEFIWIMPGHGRRYRYESVEAMRRGLADSVVLMDSDQYWAMVPGGARRRISRK